MNMISQGQIAPSQRKLFEGFVAGIAVAALAIALAWGAFAVGSTANSVAPSATTIQSMQEPGLRDQRAGERGGTVAIPQTKSTISTDSLVEQRREERSTGRQPVHKSGLTWFKVQGNGKHGALR